MYLLIGLLTVGWDANSTQPKPPHWSAVFQEKSGSFQMELDTRDSFPNGIQKLEIVSLDGEFLPPNSSFIRQIAPAVFELEVNKSSQPRDEIELITTILVIDGVSYEVVFSRETSFFFFQAILFAFLGGLLLNLMPCVFPILTMKAMSVVQSKSMHANQKLLDSLFYSLGIIFFFWILFFVFSIIRAGGAGLGWGFQLQNPSFVFLLVLVFYFMGLQMLGWIDFSVGVSGSLAHLTEKKNHWGSFASGALAVLVATPCTAPFMGTALAYAFSESYPSGFVIFTSLGLGMALPVALLQNSRMVAGWIPKPGQWMVRFKEFLSFPLLLTSVWLLWVMAGIVGRDQAFFSLGGIVILTFLVWIFKALKTPTTRTLALSFTIAFIITLVWNLSMSVPKQGSLDSYRNSNTSIDNQENITLMPGWNTAIPFSDNSLHLALTSPYPVFVYFTADWCVTCKYNERTTFQSQEAQKLFQDRKILVVRADWTNEDENITRAIEGYGRSGVPLYVYYPKDNRENPKILPQLLTNAILQKELQ